MATVTDVARAAGVSPATVSRVLTGRQTVRPDLAARVRTAAFELGYRPSGIARSLRSRRTRVWGAIVSDIRNPFFTDLVRGVEDAARDYGYSLILGNADERLDKEAYYVDLFVAERVAALLISPASQAQTDVRAALQLGIPVAAVDRELMSQEVDTVLVDNEGGARQATAHLLDQGFRRIACITGPADRTSAVQRLRGYVRAHQEAGVAVDEKLIRHADFRYAGGYAAARDLLESGGSLDSIFVANNMMTAGALEALVQLAVRIPKDVGIVGFDDTPWAPLLRPPLTTVDQPAYEMGLTVARLLQQRLEGDESPPRRVVLPTELRIRESSLREHVMREQGVSLRS